MNAFAVPLDDPAHAINAGLHALKQLQEADALPLLAAATERHPRNATLWQVKGLLHRQLDDLAPAKAAFDRAAALAPEDAKIAHGQARVAMEAGLPALALFDRARALAPNDGELLLGRAAAQLADGRAAEAIADVDSLLLRHPGWYPGHSLIARLRWMFGERADFTASYERALAGAPRDVQLWRELIGTLMHGDMFEETLATIARARAAAGPHLAFDVNEAVCAAELGRTEEADRLFAALPPVEDTTVAVRHARHLLRTARPEAAAALLDPLPAQPDGFLVWPYLSVAWRMLGDGRWDWLEGDERFVQAFDLDDALPDLGDLAALLRSLHPKGSQPLEQSVRGGTQTDGPLFRRIEPEIRRLRAAIVEAVQAYVAQLPPPDSKHPLLGQPRGAVRFAGSWSVRLLAQGRHANHIHPAGWISSALYVSLPDAAARGPAPAGWLTLGEPDAGLRLDLKPFRMIEPRPGRLALFPSTMWHGTMPFADGERLTVAFDVARNA